MQTFTAFLFLNLVSAIQDRGLGCALGGNRMLLGTVGASAATQVALVYVAPLQAVFQTEALGGGDMALALALASGGFALRETRRRWERKREQGEAWASEVWEMAWPAGTSRRDLGSSTRIQSVVHLCGDGANSSMASAMTRMCTAMSSLPRRGAHIDCGLIISAADYSFRKEHPIVLKGCTDTEFNLCCSAQRLNRGSTKHINTMHL
jgi:hypothetical protein